MNACPSFQAQRHGFNGPTIGPKPVEKNIRNFTFWQLRGGESVLPLQNGGFTQGASQAGMLCMGAVRHVSDVKCGAEMTQEGSGIIGLQSGTNRGASQAGMRFGGLRHAGDTNLTKDMSKEGHAVIGLQSGTNRFATQKGMSMGALRHAGV